MRVPSVQKLREVFGDKAPQARAILKMSRAELAALPAGAARIAECYNPPATWDVRLSCLDALGESYGVEAFELKRGGWCEYLNTGDTYSPTLLRVRGVYRVGCWGDVAERHT